MKKMTRTVFIMLLAMLMIFVSACNTDKDEDKVTLSLDKTSHTMTVGDTINLTATASVDGLSFEWSSSDQTVAAVNDGVVQAIKKGSAVITVKAGTAKATCAITVEEAPVDKIEITLDRQNVGLIAGDRVTLIPTVLVNDKPAERDITWKSSDDAIATVEDGIVIGVKSGTATITASIGDVKADCVVVVSDIYIVEFNKKDIDVDLGDTYDLKDNLIVTVNDEITTQVDVEWQSLNTDILTIDNGVLTLLKEGRATVTATVEDESARIVINVFKKIATAEEFKAIKNNLDGNYRMSGDIDFKGASVDPLAPYSETHTGEWIPFKNMFTGIFDGEGYTLSNFNLQNKSNQSLFGVTDSKSVIRNVSIYNASVNKDVCAVLSDWHTGLIENVFIYARINAAGHATQPNNYTGSVVQKNLGTVKNVIAYCEISEGIAINGIGAIVGTQTGGTIENCYSVSKAPIVRYDKTKTKTYTDNESYSANVVSLNNLQDLYNADLSGFDNTIWTIEQNKMPVTKNFDTNLISAQILNTEMSIFAGDSLQLNVKGSLFAYKLVTNVEGIELTNKGVITINNSVNKDTVFTVELYSLINNELLDTKEFTVDKLQQRYNTGFVVDLSSTDEILVEFPYQSNNIVFNNKNVAFTKDGNVYNLDRSAFALSGELTVYFDTAECVYAVPFTIADKIIRTAEEFNSLRTIAYNEANGNYIGYFMLGNNIDFNDANFVTIAHYDHTGAANNNWNPLNKMFNATINGNGYVVSNINTEVSSNSGIIGVLGKSGVIKNIGFTGINLNGISTGIVSYNMGTIENVMVQATINKTGHTSLNNSSGGIVGKNVTGSKVNNCIAVINIGSQVENYSSIAAAIGNCGPGTVNNVYTISSVPAIRVLGTGAKTNVKGFSNVQDFVSADFAMFDSTIWNLDSGSVPSIKHYVAQSVEITNAETAVYLNESYSINVLTNDSIGYEVIDNPAGIYVNQYGIVNVANHINAGTTFTVKAFNIWDNTKYSEKQLTVNARNAEDNGIIIFDLSNDINDLTIYFETEVNSITYNETEIEFTQGVNSITISDIRAKLGILDKHTDAGEFALKILSGEDEITINLIAATKVIMTPDDFKNLSSLSYVADKNDYLGYFIFGADIDMAGSVYNTIAHYRSTGGNETNNWVPQRNMFNATINGNGHTISNLEIIEDDGSIFGVVAKNGVIKNLSLTKILLNSQKSASISNMNSGLISDVFAEVHVIKDGHSAGNPTGAIVAKNAAGTVKNAIAVISLGNGATKTNVGAVVGYPQSNSVQENCFGIVGESGIAVFRNTAKVDDKTAQSVNCQAYKTIAELIAAQDFSSFSSDIWEIAEGQLPKLKN